MTTYTIDQARQIKNLLTISNPLYLKKADLNLSLWGIPKDIKFYTETTEGLELPIGATRAVCEILGESYKDERFESSKLLDIEFVGTLKDFQKEAVSKLLKNSIGVLEAVTGCGKSIIAANLITQLKQPTLILTHTKELKNQFKDKILKFTTCTDVGAIGDGEYNLKPITVGLLQSLATMSDEKFKELNSIFGCVILDEAHISPATTFYGVLNKLEAKYKYGLTGTAFRTDGLTPVIFFVLGNITHQIKLSEVKEHLSRPEYIPIETEYDFPIISSDEYLDLINDLINDSSRNEFICKNIKDYINFPTVILSTRVKQLHDLQKLLGTGVILTSQSTKKIRQKIIEDINNKKINLILSTYQLFATGIDIPHLEYLIFAAPIRSEILVRQSAGRIMRLYENKNPKIIDFADTKIGILKNQYKSRERIINSIIRNLT